MIKVNELRIGNHVLDEHGNISIINTISLGVRISNDKYKWESKSEDQIHPIPLTGELLLGCGFTYEEGFFIKDGISFEELEDGRLMIDGLGFSMFKDDFENHITSYLHELQNLYFSLTKTELKIGNHEKTNTKT